MKILKIMLLVVHSSGKRMVLRFSLSTSSCQAQFSEKLGHLLCSVVQKGSFERMSFV